MIEADTEAHEAKVEAELRRRHHPDLPEDADGNLDGVTKDELRALALGWLARPHDLAALLATARERPESPESAESHEPIESAEATADVEHGQHAVVYVRLHQAAIDGTPAVGRVEGIGPVLLSQLARLLGHAHITVRPVIDLADQVAVTAYEHPTAVRERVLLRHAGDAFPHATGQSRRVDLDHTVPYDPGGPPGQTGDHNTTPRTPSDHSGWSSNAGSAHSAGLFASVM